MGGRGGTTEGRFAGACARVNYTVPPSRRLQPCLSEQQCRRVEHGSQLAGPGGALRSYAAFLRPAAPHGKQRKAADSRGRGGDS